MASSASIEQCNLTGGRHNSAAMSLFLILPASSRDFPLTHSVAKELDAMADPHPNVLNLASMIFPFSSTSIYKVKKMLHEGRFRSFLNKGKKSEIRKYLKFHNISTSWSSNQSGTNTRFFSIQFSHISGLLIMINDLIK